MPADGLGWRAIHPADSSSATSGEPPQVATARQSEVMVNNRRQAKVPRGTRRRGRPPKYGRPARLVAVTLPNDVVDWLASVDPDVGRAVVRLHDMMVARRGPREQDPAIVQSELVGVGDGRALIVVDPDLVQGLNGVAAIPFGEARAFLALEPSWTMADLELSVVDALDHGTVDAKRRATLAEFRDQLRAWRTDRSMTFDTRTIIVAGRVQKRKPGDARRAAGS